MGRGPGQAGADLVRRRRQREALHLRRDGGAHRPLRQPAEHPRRDQGRPGHRHAAAHPRMADRRGRLPEDGRRADPLRDHADRRRRRLPDRSRRRRRRGDDPRPYREDRRRVRPEGPDQRRRRRWMAGFGRRPGGPAGRVRGPRHQRRGPGHPLLHVGLDGQAEGRAARRPGAVHLAGLGLVLADADGRRRHLVHRRHRLVEGRHLDPVRAVELRRRGAVPRRPVRSGRALRAVGAPWRQRLLRRRDGAPPVDPGRRSGTRFVGAPAHRLGRRERQPRGRRSLAGDDRRAPARRLRADGNPDDGDELSGARGEAGLHGQAAARHRSGDPGRRRRCLPRRRPGRAPGHPLPQPADHARLLERSRTDGRDPARPSTAPSGSSPATPPGWTPTVTSSTTAATTT